MNEHELNGETAPAATEALARIRALAENEAARRFGDAPPTPWQPARRPAASTRWALRAGACVIVAVLAAGGWALARSQPGPSAASRLPAPPQPAAEPVPPAKSRRDTSARSVAAEAMPAPAFRVEGVGGVWRIRAESASRYEVARELAALSGTEVPNGANALRAARPLNLRWEGSDLAAAWQAVIGNEASYAVRCRVGRCTAWIIDPSPAAQARQVAASSNFAVAVPAPAEPATEERSAYD